MQNEHYDIAILGGGINGAAIARDAALRGLSVILLDKNDFCFGASAKTSKLAHGGLRYLERYDFSLVKESLYERDLLLKNAPHLVHSLPFLFPVYSHHKRPLWLIKLGLYIYDILNWKSKLPKHENISAEWLENTFPLLESKGLEGACLYYDAQMKDHRLVFENLRSAEDNGAHIHNYSEVDHFLFHEGKIQGLEYKDLQTGAMKTISFHAIINTTGAWSNDILRLDNIPASFLVKPTKGIHLVIPQVSSKYALILSTPQDQRLFFITPWNECSLLGTTDTFYEGNPSRVTVEKDDITYLLEAYNHYFPSKKISHDAIISAFAGLRPLPASHTGFPSDISRRHTIKASPSGLITILGGKYTTHRKVAEDAIDTIIKTLPSPSQRSISEEAPYPPQREYKGKRICSLHPHRYEQLLDAIHREKARTLADWYYRRTNIGYTTCKGKLCLEDVANTFAKELGWSEEEKEREIEAYVTTLSLP